MVATPELLVDVVDGVATLTLNRPEARNSLSWTLVGALRSAVAELVDNTEARVLVLTGAGDRAFCSGADLSGMTGNESALDIHRARGELARLFEDLYACGMPTIAKVRGYCLAGGFGLAMACDLVYASTDATFGTPEINVGLWPYMITVPLMRSMAPKKALELMMTGRRIDAAEAERIGCVTAVVPASDLDAHVTAVTDTLVAKSGAAIGLGRSAFYDVWDQSASEALRQLHPMLTVGLQLDDAAEGVTAFLEKRPPVWRNR